jgi:ribosomal protein S18 acetylase RimI-like enzyme
VSAELEAALRFIAETDDAVAGELVSVGWGTALFDRERPVVWDANYVRATAAAGLDAAHLAETVEPLFAERGLAHRQLVVPHEADGQGLEPSFTALGWVPAHEQVMALTRSPAAPPDGVEEISFEALRGAVREVEVREPPGGASPAIASTLADQLASRDELIAAATRERRFVVRRDGVPVAWCRLYAGNGIGQIENVTTHPGHRNRGYGRAVVSAAAVTSRQRGDALTFLVALADDWPRKLYRRLGFEPVGTLHRFRRLPEAQRRSSVPS